MSPVSTFPIDDLRSLSEFAAVRTVDDALRICRHAACGVDMVAVLTVYVTSVDETLRRSNKETV